MSSNNSIDKTSITNNGVYHSMKEFRDKFLPESIITKFISTDEEARELGILLARESINNVKFNTLLSANPDLI